MNRGDRRLPAASWLVFVAALGFLAGMLVMAAMVTIFPSGARTIAQPLVEASNQPVTVRPSKPESPPPVTTPAPPATSVLSANPFESLRRKNLELPVPGVKREDLRDSFNETRGSARRHEAIDILAPRHTPVIAVEDGTIARLFFSDAGGITIYQFDPSTTYVYYYAHLQKYADGVKEGSAVKRGDVIAYVGTSGNAPRDTPHLHFAIFKMTDEKKWWEGTAIDPYSVLK